MYDSTTPRLMENHTLESKFLKHIYGHSSHPCYMTDNDGLSFKNQGKVPVWFHRPSLPVQSTEAKPRTSRLNKNSKMRPSGGSTSLGFARRTRAGAWYDSEVINYGRHWQQTLNLMNTHVTLH